MRTVRIIFITTAVFFALLVVHFCKWRPSPRRIPGSIDWGVMRLYHPPPEIKELPTGEKRILPSIQAPLDAFKDPYEADFRREAVTKVFRRSWESYKKYGWMGDELAPVSGTAKVTTGYATTMVETLDMLWIMDLKDDFYLAASAAASIDYTNATVDAINIFDTNIRHLGGLLSAYDLSGEKALLEKAVELGDMLLAGFDTPNHLPTFWLNFVDADTGDQVAGEDEASAGPASMCLEFTRLSQVTGDHKYYDAADRVTRFLERIQFKTKLPGMWPKTLDFKSEKAPGTRFSLGAQADVLYEYLPKMHQLLGGLDDTYEKLYKGAAKPILENLLFRPVLPNEDDILFAGDFLIHHRGTELVPESQHISCFAGGMFGLGGKLFEDQSHLRTAERLARGCGWAFEQFPTGVMPEIFGLLPCDKNDDCPWDEDRWQRQGDKSLSRGWLHARDPRYLLRPDAIESIFIMYRLTGKEMWRQLAWEMFEGIIWSTETEFAHSAISDVKAKGDTEKIDSMESFWFAATLKYFYLIFSPPTLMSLDEYVFNAEAHPFRLPRTGVLEQGQEPVV